MVVKHHSPAPSAARPIDGLLAQYAIGDLPRALHALVGSHCELNSASARFVADLESLRAAEVARMAPVALKGRDAMLAAIFDAPERPVRALTSDGVFPHALRSYTGFDSAETPWRRVLPGIRECVLEDADGIEAKLFWIKAGRKLPHHTHEGQEFTVVLRGGFSDINGHYARGDIAIADADVDHRPIADDDGEDCICFAVTDAPLRLTGPVGKFVQSLLRG
jgi:putative transcriptional regulator